MAEDRLITVVDVENPDDESFGYVKTIPRPMTDEELDKMKPVLKKAGAYKFFRMDFNFSDGPAVKQFLESVELEEFRRAEKLKIVQDDMRGIVAGKEVVINADLVEKTFGLVDDGLNISRPNKKSHDLHMFYIKPVYVQKCSTKRGINLKHFKSEFFYVPNFARQVCAYCTGLLSEGYINFSQYRAVDCMIRKKPVNWNRYLLQNFQDRLRKFRASPFNLYFGGTLTALIYKALGIDYSLVSKSNVPRLLPPPTIKKRGRPFRKNIETSPKPVAVQHPSTLLLADQPSNEQRGVEIVEATHALPSLEPGSCSETPVPLAERASLRTSTLKKRKAFPPLKSRKGKVARRDQEAPKDILQKVSVDLKVKKRRGRAAPPRPVTMGKLELLTRFSHRASDLDAEMQDKLTTMYYTASGIKPRRKADVGYKGCYTLSTEELKKKCEQYYALEEELLLEHIVAKKGLEKAEKRFKELKRALVNKDAEIAEKTSAVTELEFSLKTRDDEILALQAELGKLRSMGGVHSDVRDVEMNDVEDVEGEKEAGSENVEMVQCSIEANTEVDMEEDEHADETQREEAQQGEADVVAIDEDVEQVKEAEHADETQREEAQQQGEADEAPVEQAKQADVEQGKEAEVEQVKDAEQAEAEVHTKDTEQVQDAEQADAEVHTKDTEQVKDAEQTEAEAHTKEAEQQAEVEQRIGPESGADMNKEQAETEQGGVEAGKVESEEAWRVVPMVSEEEMEIGMEGLER